MISEFTWRMWRERVVEHTAQQQAPAGPSENEKS